jgi:hypothetical protein
MDVDVSTAQRVPFDWFDGNESDDEINLVTGQCKSSSNPFAWSTMCTTPAIFRSVSAWPMVLHERKWLVRRNSG